MDPAIAARSRRLTLSLAVLGLVIAVGFGVYFDTDPRLESPAADWAGGVSLVLCPGSLLFVTFIDAEPGTNGFLFMWTIIGLINLGLYAALGAFLGRIMWKSE
jgi:hypothetical protein